MEVTDKIMKAAYGLFIKHGLRRVSVDDICSEVRISKKTFYAKFKQKEDLVMVIIEKMREKKQAMKERSTEGNAIDRFFAEYKVNQKDTAQQHVEFFFDLRKYYPEIYNANAEIMKKKNIEDTSLFIKQGIDEGLFRKDINHVAIATLIHATFSDALIELKSATNLKMNEIFELLYDALIHMIANEAGLEYYHKLKNK